MPTKTIIKIAAVHILSSILFYHENIGINILFMHFAIMAYLTFDSLNKKAGENFIGMTVLMTVLAFGSFMTNTYSHFFYLILLPYWVVSSRVSLKYILLIFISGIVKVVFSFYTWLKSFNIVNRVFFRGANQGQRIVQIISIFAASVILLIFTHIYATSNPIFEQYYKPITEMVDIWNILQLIAFQFMISFILRHSSSSLDYANHLLKGTQKQYIDALSNWATNLRTQNVQVGFTYLRTGLIVILLAITAAEVYLLTSLKANLTIQELSKAVHNSFDKMVASFILTFIIMGIDRFIIQYQKRTSTFANVTYYLIILFNLVLIGTTMYKDVLYINASFLTELRLELLVWLVFAASMLIIILLSSPIKTSYQTLYDRFILTSFTFLCVNIGLPYNELITLSMVSSKYTHQEFRNHLYHHGNINKASCYPSNLLLKLYTNEERFPDKLYQFTLKHISIENQMLSYNGIHFLENRIFTQIAENRRKAQPQTSQNGTTTKITQ